MVEHGIYLQYASAMPRIHHLSTANRSASENDTQGYTHISPTTSGGQMTLVSGLTIASVASAIGYPNPQTRTNPGSFARRLASSPYYQLHQSFLYLGHHYNVIRFQSLFFQQ